MREVRAAQASATNVVPRNQVCTAHDVIRVGPDQVKASSPRVELIRDGDVVRAIEVVCSCGERTTIRCDYD